MPNKANFKKAENGRNHLFYNDYQQQTTNNELPKTNPIKPNFGRRGPNCDFSCNYGGKAYNYNQLRKGGV